MFCNTLILVIIVAVVASVLVNVYTEELHIEAYYWKDYEGKIPEDALAGGEDDVGHPIYMGQILHDGKLSPAKIYPNDTKAYYGYCGKEQSGTEFIKILCTPHPDRFYWIPTKTDKIHLLTNHHLIVGGYYPGRTMYFGRVHYRNETSVGKVSTSINRNKGLYITQDGIEYHFNTFEILAYNRLEPRSLRI